MKLLTVSNRLPVIVEKKDGLNFKQSAGGLVSGISDYLGMLRFSNFPNSEHLWFGYPGEIGNKQKEKLIEKLLSEYHCQPIFLPRKLLRSFIMGFLIKHCGHCFIRFLLMLNTTMITGKLIKMSTLLLLSKF